MPSAVLYARINALISENRQLKQENEQLRAEKPQAPDTSFHGFDYTARCQCGHGKGAHRAGTKGCLGGTGLCICSRFVGVQA